MRTVGVRSLIPLCVAVAGAILTVSCQSQSGSADRHVPQVQDTMPTVDHHPPPRTPEN